MSLFNFLVALSVYFYLQTVDVQEWMIFAEEYSAQMSVLPLDNYGIPLDLNL